MYAEARGHPNGSTDTADVARLVAELEGLKQALLSRDVIGQAKGILMERLRVGPDEAFDHLRVLSQNQNRKLVEVARQLTETGEWPPRP